MKCPKCHDGLMVPERTQDYGLIFYIMRCINCGKTCDPPAEDK